MKSTRSGKEKASQDGERGQTTLKTVYFSAQGPRSESDRELYSEAVRMMQNIENFAALAAPLAYAYQTSQEDAPLAILADQPCAWEGAQESTELVAHAVVKVDAADGEVLACHGLQPSTEVDSFAFRRGNDGARLYDWTDGARKIHVYSAEPPQGFLVIVQE